MTSSLISVLNAVVVVLGVITLAFVFIDLLNQLLFSLLRSINDQP